MIKRAPPLSPHLGIYRWQYTNTLSILNRLTGVALSLGLPLFVFFLASVAGGPERYDTARAVFTYPLVTLALIGWTFAFFFHLLNGIRHLVWDVGYGLERAAARKSGWFVVVGSILLTVGTWVLIAVRVTGNAGGVV